MKREVFRNLLPILAMLVDLLEKFVVLMWQPRPSILVRHFCLYEIDQCLQLVRINRVLFIPLHEFAHSCHDVDFLDGWEVLGSCIVLEQLRRLLCSLLAVIVDLLVNLVESIDN